MDDLGIHNLFESSADAGKEIIVNIPECESDTTNIESEITHIPIDLLTNKPKAYQPDTVSLGPFHFGQSHLHKSEQIKNQLLSRRFPYRVRDFQKLVDRMTDDQFNTKIRQWYDLNSTESVPEARKLGSMMALDGIFLLQVLREISPLSTFERCLSFMEIYPFADPAYILNLDKNATHSFQLLLQPFRVQEDIMKLQNQIPLFALKKIIQWEEETYQAMTQTYKAMTQEAGKGKDKMLQQKAGKEKDKMLQDMMLQARTCTHQDLNSILKKAFRSLSPFPDREDLVIFPGESSHILGFVYGNIIGYRNIIGSSHSTDRTHSNEMGKNKNSLPAGAVFLDKKRVKFAALKGPFDKIRFDGKTWTFHLPRIEIDNRTDTVMRNLLAFELYVCIDESKPIMCYVELMDQLINTAEDIQVLKNYGIIRHHLGADQEVADMWNEMRKGHDKSFQYGPIDTAIDDVIKFYGISYVEWTMKMYYDELIQKYLSKPWPVASLIVGCIFVITSVLQTIFAWEQLRR